MLGVTLVMRKPFAFALSSQEEELLVRLCVLPHIKWDGT